MTENTFPLHKVDAIVNFVCTEILTGQEAKQFTKIDLTPKPNPDSVRRLYMRILQLLFDLRPECHFMVPLTENIQHPAFHEMTTAIMSVYFRMRQFLPVCCVHDFQLSDLLAPNAKRTITVLSGIMNFLHFRMQRMDLVLEHKERFRTDMDKLLVLTNGIKEAERRIEKLTTVPPEQQAEAEELASALADLHAASIHEYQEVNGRKVEIAELKTVIAERSQKVTRMKVDASSLKENIDQLKSQIVESPEELRAQMDKMKEAVKNIKLSIKQADERLVELQMAVRGVSQQEAEVQMMLRLLQDLQSGMIKTQHLLEEVQRLEELYDSQVKELKSLGKQEEQLKRALGMKLDKDSKQQIRRQRKKEMKEQHVLEVLGQCDHVQQQREEMADQIKEVTVETHQIRSKIQNLREVCQRETKKAQGLFEHLLASLDQFHKRIEAHVEEGNHDLSRMTCNFYPPM